MQLLPSGLFSFQEFFKIFDVIGSGGKLAGLFFFYYLDDAVVDGRRDAVLAPEFADDAVYRVDLARLSVPYILEHRGDDADVTLHGDRDE